MKKSTILTFATAAAIVATSAGTFATWDTLSASQTVTLTYADPVVVSMKTLTAPTAKLGDSINGQKSVEIDVPVDVEGYARNENDAIQLSSVTDLSSKDIKVTFKKGESTLTDGKDTAFDATNTYKAVVEVTGQSKVDANLPASLEIKAELIPASVK